MEMTINYLHVHVIKGCVHHSSRNIGTFSVMEVLKYTDKWRNRALNGLEHRSSISTNHKT